MMQTKLQEDHGNDVTQMIGAGTDDASQRLFDAFRAAHTKAAEAPCVDNFRECVEAFDKWQELFLLEAQL